MIILHILQTRSHLNDNGQMVDGKRVGWEMSNPVFKELNFNTEHTNELIRFYSTKNHYEQN